jgi:hypothetical protein
MHRLFLRSRVLDERDIVLDARNSQRHVQPRFDINIRSYFSAWKRVRPTRLPTEVGSRRICSGFPVGVDSSMELGRPDWLLGQSSRSCVFESDTLDTCPSPPLSGMLYFTVWLPPAWTVGVVVARRKCTLQTQPQRPWDPNIDIFRVLEAASMENFRVEYVSLQPLSVAECCKVV